MRAPLGVFVLGLCCLWPALAAAHTAPSADVNNRYLKATLLPDGIRLSFTLFLGDRPGAAERRRIDENGDGRLDDAEAQTFGKRLLTELSPGLEVIVDGRPRTGWTVADVGLGTPTVTGGALSVDFRLTVPIEGGSHTFSVEDATVVSLPGESETRIEESPGTTLVACHLAGQTGLQPVFPFAGNPRVAGERRVEARFTAPGGPKSGRWWLLAVPVVVLVSGAAAVLRYRKV